MNSIINNKFKELLLPTMFIAMALNITSIVDSAFVSTFVGPNALAAVEILEPLILLITVIEWLFGLGGQVLALNKKAEFDEDGSNRYFTVSVVGTLILCIIIILICYVFPDQLISILHPPHDVVPYVKQYAPFLFLCFPVSTLLGVLSQFMRIDGQPRFSSAVIIVANVLNIILDFTFLYFFKMGVSGAALATLIGEVVGLLLILKYHFDPKRTFKFIVSFIPLKTWFKSLVNIVKTGFPSASMGLFDVVFIYVMNRILIAVLNNTGLVAYTISVDALLLISILIIGIADTITSIVPLYYSQNDFRNVKNLVNFAIKVTVACSVAFTLFLWIWPQGFLMLYNLHNYVSTPIVLNAVKICSIGFFASAIATILIFYYEAIDQSTISTIMAAVAALFGPLAGVFAFYPILGNNALWLASTFGTLITIAIAFIYVKIYERRQSELSGMLFINKSILEKSRNYVVINRNGSDRSELFNYINGFNVSESDLNNLNMLFDKVFDENNDDLNVEVLVIDYDDNITVNLKDEGKGINIDEFKKEFGLEDKVKYSQVLGCNNVEYVMAKS